MLGIHVGVGMDYLFIFSLLVCYAHVLSCTIYMPLECALNRAGLVFNMCVHNVCAGVCIYMCRCMHV